MEARTLAEALEAIEAGRADGVELASAVLPSCGAILLLALVRVPGGDGMALALGRWKIGHEGQPVPPAMPLVLAPADLGVAHALLVEAEAAMPTATLEPGSTVTLAHDGSRLLVELAAPPGNDRLWLALSLADGSALVAVPLPDRAVLRRVLSEAGRELAGAGLVEAEPATRH
jgi:hypothetical protein